LVGLHGRKNASCSNYRIKDFPMRPITLSRVDQ
jgi:hypothetical protein